MNDEAVAAAELAYQSGSPVHANHVKYRVTRGDILSRL